MDGIDNDELRADGRRPREIRDLQCELGVLPKADGSARFHMGNTKVLAAVYGPREVVNRSQAQHDKALVRCEFSTALFSTGGERRKRSKGDRRGQEIALDIKQTMEAVILVNLLPRTQIDIYVQLLQADGGTRAACLNAATLALANAGVPLRDMVASVGVGVVENRILLDCNHEEDIMGGAEFTVGYLPTNDKFSLVQMDPKIEVEKVEDLLSVAKLGAKGVADFMRGELLEHTKNQAKLRGAFRQ